MLKMDLPMTCGCGMNPPFPSNYREEGANAIVTVVVMVSGAQGLGTTGAILLAPKRFVSENALPWSGCHDGWVMVDAPHLPKGMNSLPK